eukprot:403209-Hanusia_phi.AAC.1
MITVRVSQSDPSVRRPGPGPGSPGLRGLRLTVPPGYGRARGSHRPAVMKLTRRLGKKPPARARPAVAAPGTPTHDPRSRTRVTTASHDGGVNL